MDVPDGLPRAACTHCASDMEPSHMFGDVRYYVCRPCNAWSIPFPPLPVRAMLPTAHQRTGDERPAWSRYIAATTDDHSVPHLRSIASAE